MPRYFTRKPRAFWVEDETYTSGNRQETPQVCDHEPTDTGLLDKDGNAIWRGPNPMGFLWETE